MKKTLVLLVAFVLISSVALAEQSENKGGNMTPELTSTGPGEGGSESGQETGQGETVQKENRTQEGEEKGTQNKQMLQSGLENALSNVKNENAKMRLQQNIEKFMTKYQARLEEKMQDVEVEEVDEETGAVTIKAKEQVKWFGLIKGTATKRFEMDDKGNVNEKAPWYKFLYGEVDEVEE